MSTYRSSKNCHPFTLVGQTTIENIGHGEQYAKDARLEKLRQKLNARERNAYAVNDDDDDEAAWHCCCARRETLGQTCMTCCTLVGVVPCDDEQALPLFLSNNELHSGDAAGPVRVPKQSPHDTGNFVENARLAFGLPPHCSLWRAILPPVPMLTIGAYLWR